MKRKLALFISAIILVSSVMLFSSCASNDAPDKFTRSPSACGEDLLWSFSDGTVTISGNGKMWDFDTVFDTPWRLERKNITKVVIESGVTSIGARAFESCPNLVEISLPSSLEKIGDAAFEDDYRLAEVRLPASLRSIGNGAFRYCDGIVFVSFGGSYDDWLYVKTGDGNSPLLDKSIVFLG